MLQPVLILKKILVYKEYMNFLNERKLPLDVPLGALHKFSETRIACVDATEFLSDVYKMVHERKNS